MLNLPQEIIKKEGGGFVQSSSAKKIFLSTVKNKKNKRSRGRKKNVEYI